MPSHRVAIVHTTPVTVEPLRALVSELMPGYDVLNWVDDSILPQLAESDGDLRQVEGRLTHYYRFAEQAGALAILNACSSVGELVARASDHVSIPVVRIDEAMAEEAVRRGRRIGVAATLETTLRPTLALLQAKAREAARQVELVPVVAHEAYRKLMEGDREAHDDLLLDALTGLAASTDVVVLAQASMARVLQVLPEEQRSRFLTSPRLGVERLRAAVEGRDGRRAAGR